MRLPPAGRHPRQPPRLTIPALYSIKRADALGRASGNITKTRVTAGVWRSTVGRGPVRNSLLRRRLRRFFVLLIALEFEGFEALVGNYRYRAGARLQRVSSHTKGASARVGQRPRHFLAGMWGGHVRLRPPSTDSLEIFLYCHKRTLYHIRPRFLSFGLQSGWRIAAQHLGWLGLATIFKKMDA